MFTLNRTITQQIKESTGFAYSHPELVQDQHGKVIHQCTHMCESKGHMLNPQVLKAYNEQLLRDLR